MYTIGIDLGTTNCTMAYAKGEGEITQFLIPQIIAAGNQSDDPSLPSFVYFPLPEELKTKIAGIDWDAERNHCVGIFARERGSELPVRMIASAKSWLCHSGIDRRAAILPLNADEDSDKMSPLEACASLLKHLKEAWNVKMPKAAFNKQKILITVPASFDPSARQLVQEAAELAGYPEVVLLEEPQAAFYAWLHAHETDWRKTLKVGDNILVVDIGGGTTDFSLITVEDNSGDLSLKRLAVGSHLLLGGDNIDLGLAYLAKNKMEEQGHNIDDWQLQALVHACRQAKEKLMSDDSPKSVDVTVMGRGSKLIGGTIKTKITQSEAQEFIVNGFMPVLAPTEHSLVEKRSGIQQIGLPYAQDARITAQLAKFLSMTGEVDSNSMDHFIVPSVVLFNGGTMKSAALRKRLIDVLNDWAQQLGKDPVKELPGSDFDFAVSRGATYYGLAREGKGIRIKSGTSRSYYIGVEDARPAIPGMEAPLKAYCVVPFGMEEGSELELPKQEFALVLGETATFKFFSHATPVLSDGTEPKMGTVVRQWKQELSELHPLETRLEKNEYDGKTVKVRLKSRVTELGVLELWCFSDDNRQWKLEFDIRQEESEPFEKVTR